MPLPLASPTITIQPLKANPELSLHIQDDSESIIEYRVANYRTLKSGRVLNRYGWGWFDITILPVLVASLRLLDLIQWDKWRLGIPLTWNEVRLNSLFWIGMELTRLSLSLTRISGLPWWCTGHIRNAPQPSPVRSHSRLLGIDERKGSRKR